MLLKALSCDYADLVGGRRKQIFGRKATSGPSRRRQIFVLGELA